MLIDMLADASATAGPYVKSYSMRSFGGRLCGCWRIHISFSDARASAPARLAFSSNLIDV